jgi:cytochrome c-type biogenesis protein CcmH/NrfF
MILFVFAVAEIMAACAAGKSRQYIAASLVARYGRDAAR